MRRIVLAHGGPMKLTPSRFLSAATLGLAASGCAYKAGLYPLQTLPESNRGTEHLTVQSKVELLYQPTRGWDLLLDLQLRAESGRRPLVDLSRTMLRTDGLRWVSCRLPPEEDPEHLRLRLYEEESVQMLLRCIDNQRPESRLEIRVPVSGAGGRGYLELVYSGLSNANDASSWELD